MKFSTLLHRAAIGIAIGAISSLAAGQGKVAMLLPGSINDQSWNASGYAALVRLKESGTEIAFSENVAAADHVETMKDYARRGFSPVIGHSGRFLSAAQRVSPEFEKIQFIVGSGSAGAGKNVMSIGFDHAQMAYLMGVLAARMTKTGKVAFISALEGLPNTVSSAGGFRTGVKATRPDVEVRIVYLKDGEDSGLAKEAALALIAGGTDVLHGVLNAGHIGMIQAAKDKNVFVSGRSFAHADAAPQNLLTNVIEKWADMYVAAAKEVQSGKLIGEFRTFGYDSVSPGAELLFARDKAFNPVVPAPVVAAVEAMKKKLASGELKVKPTKEDARGGV